MPAEVQGRHEIGTLLHKGYGIYDAYLFLCMEITAIGLDYALVITIDRTSILSLGGVSLVASGCLNDACAQTTP